MNPMRKTKRELVKILKFFEKEIQILRRELILISSINDHSLENFETLYGIIDELCKSNASLELDYDAAKTKLAQLKRENSKRSEAREEKAHLQTIANLESLIDDFSSIILNLNTQNEALKTDLEKIQKENALISERHRSIIDLAKCFDETNRKLSIDYKNTLEKISDYVSLAQSNEKLFVLVDKNLEIQLMSDLFKQQVKHSDRLKNSSLMDMISEKTQKRKSKHLNKVKSVLRGKQSETLQSFYFKYSPLTQIKTKAEVVKTTYNNQPAAMVFMENRLSQQTA